LCLRFLELTVLTPRQISNFSHFPLVNKNICNSRKTRKLSYFWLFESLSFGGVLWTFYMHSQFSCFPALPNIFSPIINEKGWKFAAGSSLTPHSKQMHFWNPAIIVCHLGSMSLRKDPLSVGCFCFYLVLSSGPALFAIFGNSEHKLWIQTYYWYLRRQWRHRHGWHNDGAHLCFFRQKNPQKITNCDLSFFFRPQNTRLIFYCIKLLSIQQKLGFWDFFFLFNLWNTQKIRQNKRDYSRYM